MRGTYPTRAMDAMSLADNRRDLGRWNASKAQALRIRHARLAKERGK
jgi:hypothetical protein